MSQSNNETQQGVSGARYIVERQPGLAGQYQVAYNPERDALFVTCSFNHTKTHGTLCATLARLNARTLETELTAYLPVVEDHNPGQEGLYQIQAAYGLALDNQRGLVWTGGTRTQTFRSCGIHAPRILRCSPRASSTWLLTDLYS